MGNVREMMQSDKELRLNLMHGTTLAFVSKDVGEIIRGNMPLMAALQTMSITDAGSALERCASVALLFVSPSPFWLRL